MNEDYSYNIRRILEEGRKCKERGGVMGPTGPRGPQGPATIRVGNTVTGAPGTMASVVNAGSLDNAVLTFTIPAGPTGPSGATGATGPTGPAGAQEKIDFGRKYNTSVDTIALEANIPQNISLGSTGPTSGITTATQNTLTITTAGTYKVDYFFSGSSSADTDLSVEVKQNANPIGSTTISKDVTQDENVDFIGSTINTFNNGDEIGLQIKSTVIANISPASGTNAYLNIVKIG